MKFNKLGFFFVLLFLFLIVRSRSTSKICPPIEALQGCECYNNSVILSCVNKGVPDLENYYLEEINLENAVSRLTVNSNTTCNKLTIKGKVNDFIQIKPIMDFKFNYLKLTDLDTNLIHRIFEAGSTYVTTITIRVLKIDKLDLNFTNFPNLESIYMGGRDSQNRIRVISSLIFSRLKFLVDVYLDYCEIKELEPNSLVFNSQKYLNIDLSGNEINVE